MAPDLGELLAALPDDADTERRPPDALAELVTKLSQRPVPVGAVSRLWSLGGLHARIALAYLAYWIRSSYATRDERERRLNETHLSAAIRLLGGMSYLRGAIMKIGQMLANYPRIVPAQFAETLGRLHFDAPPMHYALLREHVAHELGGEPESVFASFDRTAFAAASLGQVHRARLPSGEPVAVKIQYPNISRTVRDDFRNLGALLLPMRLSKDWDNIREQFEDLRGMLEMETDYRQEADFLERARVVFGEGDGVLVPRVHRGYSTGRVLTMDLVDGVHLDAYLATHPSQAERDSYGERIMRASYRLSVQARLWYADPQPGNYLFMPDGRLGLIDFGCCRAFSEEEWTYFADSCRAFFAGDEALTGMFVRAWSLESLEGVGAHQLEIGRAWTHWACDVLNHDGPFDFGSDEYLNRGIELITVVFRNRYFRSLPVNNWLFRNMLGIRAILYRLKARVNAKRINDEEGESIYR